jgi:Ni/Fe-hydrogenase 1 B-type cytochrome subunit
MNRTKALPDSYQRLYAWELPVRFYHWVNADSILVLGVTGFLIGRPLSLAYMPETSQQYWFGAVRFTHFAAGHIFLFNFLVRVYWGFVGNRFVAWNQFIPAIRKQFQEIVEVLKVDVLQTKLSGPISLATTCWRASSTS